MNYLDTDKLVRDLATNKLSEYEKTKYVWAGWILFSFLGYSTVTFANVGRTWLGGFEFFILTIVTTWGVSRCFDKGNGNESKTFVVDFACLTVAVAIRVYFAIWGLFWLTGYMFRAWVHSTIPSDVSTPDWLSRLGTGLPWLPIFLAVTSAQLLFFIRMAVHFEKLAGFRKDSSVAQKE
ncbi:MAG: hypothetical protein ABI583_11530 [Betaproteobacteria bacterium]